MAWVALILAVTTAGAMLAVGYQRNLAAGGHRAGRHRPRSSALAAGVSRARPDRFELPRMLALLDAASRSPIPPDPSITSAVLLRGAGLYLRGDSYRATGAG